VRAESLLEPDMKLPVWAAALHTFAMIADVLVVVLVVVAWAWPKRYRPWYRAALLVGCTYFAPKKSVFLWLVTTLFFVVAAAMVLTLRKPDAFREES